MVFFLPLREVERNGGRDKRCGFERHGIGNNGALAICVEHARGLVPTSAPIPMNTENRSYDVARLQSGTMSVTAARMVDS